VRNLDAARAEGECEIDDLGDPVDGGAMHDRIHGEEELAPPDLDREGSFPGKCTGITGDVQILWGNRASIRRLRYRNEVLIKLSR
jgi:hypothetical protein